MTTHDAAREPFETDAPLEGEVLPADTGPEVPSRARAAARRLRDVLSHPRTRRTGRAVKRHGLHIGVGTGVVVRRMRDGRGTARYERMMRAAETAGDHEKALEWEARREAFKTARHTRRIERLTALPHLVRAILTWTVITAAVMLALGIVLAGADHTAAAVIAPFQVLITVVSTLVAVASVVVPLALALSPFAVVGWVWHAGRRHTGDGGGLGPALVQDGDGVDGREVIPSESAILTALSNLGIPALAAAFKQGWGTARYGMQAWEQSPVQDGHGWRARIRLPQQVTVEMINKRRAILAHNLVRLPVEVWATEPKDRPGVLDLWVAEPGALTGPVPPWPWLAKLGQARGDYFRAVPLGLSVRGDTTRGLLFEANYALAGMMGSGKSSLIIALLCGAILDPLVDADVYVMAENADYEPMRPRLSRLVTGAGDATVQACLARLRGAYHDLEVRGRALREHDARAVTRELAETDPRLRPRVIVIDECQALYMHETHGEEAADLTVKLISAARKYAVTLIFATPEPSSTSLPRKVMAVTRCKACFAVGDQHANDAILGTGSYRAGVSALGLEPKTEDGPGDVGTCMTRGITPKPGLLRSFFLTPDHVRAVTARALALREGTTALPAASDDRETKADRDPLADIAAVLADDPRVKTQEVLHRLAARDPHYRGWTFTDLRKALAAVGAAPHKSTVGTDTGVMVVDRAKVHDALTTRHDEDEDATDPPDGDSE